MIARGRRSLGAMSVGSHRAAKEAIMPNLSGKTALIMGASRGIGRARCWAPKVRKFSCTKSLARRKPTASSPRYASPAAAPTRWRPIWRRPTGRTSRRPLPAPSSATVATTSVPGRFGCRKRDDATDVVGLAERRVQRLRRCPVDHQRYHPRGRRFQALSYR